MAINKIRLAQQFNEIAAVSAAEQVTRILHDFALVPGAKQFARNRDLANERWMQLRDIAQQWQLEDEVASLKEDLAEALSVKAWNPVEVKPKALNGVLALLKSGDYAIAYMTEVGDWHESYTNHSISVTHWMPLPDPPQT